MDFNMFKYLILCVISQISSSNSYVEIILQSSNWFEASNYCSVHGGRLAKPNDMNHSSCTAKSINIWLGKFDRERLTTWMAKQGCFCITDRRKQLFTKSSLLNCYRACNSTAFGYKEPWCSCDEDAIVNNASASPCFVEFIKCLWLYKKTDVSLSNDDLKMDCITAQCAANETFFKAEDCSLKKAANCQATGFSSFFTAHKSTQASSERFCKQQMSYLASSQVCSPFGNGNRTTAEFWTGIHRFRYNTTYLTGNEIKDVNNTDIYNCVYTRWCPTGSGRNAFEYIENCRRRLDGFACLFHGPSVKFMTVKASPESSLSQGIVRSSKSSYLNLEHESKYMPRQSTALTTVLTKNSVSLYKHYHTASSILPTSVSLQRFSEHPRTHVISSSVDTSAESAITKIIDMSNTVYSAAVTEQYIKQVTDNNVKASPESSLSQGIVRSSKSSYLNLEHESKYMPLQSTALTTVLTKNSVSLYKHYHTASSILPTSVSLQRFSEHPRTHVISSSVDTSAESAITKIIDMSNTVYSAAVTEQYIKQVTDNNGFIVYVSVPVIVVIILVFLGILGFYRLWRRKAFQENTVYNDMHMTINNDPNDQYTELDLHKKNTAFENDYENELRVSSDDNAQYMNI